MASAIFACTLVILAGLSVNYGYPAVPGEWPADCQGYNYCWIKPNTSYPDKDFKRLLKGVNMTSLTTPLNDTVQDRIGEEDIAGCQSKPLERRIYMIKDFNNTIWYVPQTDLFKWSIETEECWTANRVLRAGNLDELKLKKKRVHCWERRINYNLPVLSKDRTRLESRSPYKGIPFGCSAKIIAKA